MTTVEPIRSLKKIRKVEQFLAQQSYRDLLLFTFGINSGLRISDILKLDVKDVKNKSYIQIKETKTNKFKKFPINTKLKNMIAAYTKNKEPNEPLFLTVYNNRMNRFTAYKIITFACKKVNIEENIGTHSLRKTFGYHFYKKFKDIAMLQKILNHTSQDVTMRYIGIEQEEIYKNYKNFTL